MGAAEIAAVVSEALETAGLDAVLSGGAVVTIYSENQYESFDLDFVTIERRERIAAVMTPLGFTAERGRHFVHPRTRYLVEFPSGLWPSATVRSGKLRALRRLRARFGS